MRARLKRSKIDYCASSDITGVFNCEYNFDSDFHVEEYKFTDIKSGECSFFLGTLDHTITLILRINSRTVFQMHEEGVLICHVEQDKKSIYIEMKTCKLRITVLPLLKIDILSIHHIDEESSD